MATDTKAQINKYLNKLCKELGAPPLALDAAGEVGLQGRFQGQDVAVTVSLRPAEDLIQFFSPLSPKLDQVKRERLLDGFMAINVSPKDTAGLAFGLNPLDGTLLLTYSLLGQEHSYASFRRAFLRLFGAAAVWQERLGQL